MYYGTAEADLTNCEKPQALAWDVVQVNVRHGSYMHLEQNNRLIHFLSRSMRTTNGRSLVKQELATLVKNNNPWCVLLAMPGENNLLPQLVRIIAAGVCQSLAM